MKPPEFHYERPETVDEAIDALRSDEKEATILAGGQSLVPQMNFRSVNPELIVDLNHVGELDYVRSDGNELAIGAMTRQSAARASSDIEEHCPLLTDALQYVGHGPTRHRGTIGGNVANADPRSEIPAVLVALGGSVVVRNGDGERTIDAADFFRGEMDTALDPGELLIEVRVPIRSNGTGYSFQEHAIIDWDWPIVGVASTLEIDGGTCRNVRLSYVGVDGSPIRIDAAEEAAEGDAAGDGAFDAAAESARESVSVTVQKSAESSDARVNQVSRSNGASATIHGDPEYKRELVAALTRRAMKEAHDRTTTEHRGKQ